MPLTAAEFRSVMLESNTSLKNGLIGIIPEIRKAVREDTVEIVGQAIEEFSRLLDIKFDRIESRFNIVDKKLEETDGRFKEIDGKLEGISHQVSGVHNRLDMHLLDCVKRDEHKKLEKRIGKIEKAGRAEAFA